MMNGDRIQNRLVLHFPGFELTGADHHYQRFLRECKQFQKLWNVRQEIDTLKETDGVSTWQTTTQGSDWSVSTRLVLMEWGSFLNQPEQNTFWRRIGLSTPRYLAHYLTRAPWRYFAANWRYGLFFIYPVIILSAVTLLSLVFAWAINLLLGGLSALLVSAISLIVFFATFRIFAQHWKVPLELDLLHHTHSVALKQNNVAHSRLAIFSSVLKREIETSTADEIIITTHSFGSVYATAAIANVLRTDPSLLKNKKLSITAIGSNLLQVGLMREGQWLRDDLELVLTHANIQWIEIYAANDPICFYKSGPEKVINETPANPIIAKRVRFSKMISPRRYRRMRSRFFRLHRQLIMANECYYFYDFYLLLFGPRNVVDLLKRNPITDV